MVTSVMAVSGVGRTRKDKQHLPYSGISKKNEKGLFSKILRETVTELADDVRDCCTTTYGPDSKMQTFLYQAREYHY